MTAARVIGGSRFACGWEMLLENLLVVLARTVLGLFLSVVLAVAAYLGTLLPVVQAGELGSIDYRLLATIPIGVGAGVGGYLGWFKREPSPSVQLLLAGVAVAAGIFGAWVGERYDETMWGAVLGANLPLGVVGTLKAVGDA